MKASRTNRRPKTDRRASPSRRSKLQKGQPLRLSLFCFRRPSCRYLGVHIPSTFPVSYSLRLPTDATARIAQGESHRELVVLRGRTICDCSFFAPSRLRVRPTDSSLLPPGRSPATHAPIALPGTALHAAPAETESHRYQIAPPEHSNDH
jgi:hypothetical protein